MAQDRLPLTATPPAKKRGILYWRWLLAPMLLASLGLHGLILFVPIAPSDEDLVPPPDPEEEGIAITKIEAPQPRSAIAAPANAGTVKTAPSAAAPQTRATPTPAVRSARPTNSATRATSQGGGDRSTTNRAASNRPSAADQTPSGANFAQMPSVDNPSADAPAAGGRATSGNGRTPGNPANPAAAGPDPFETYIEAFATYNGVKISEADAAETQTIWLQSFSDRGAEFTNLDIEPLKIFEPVPYESDICLPNAPDDAELLVLVNADGTVEEYQPFMQRTGYRRFDNAAADTIRQHDFPAADAPKAYLVEVAVDYDDANCQWPPQVDKLPDAYFAVLDNYIGPTLTTPAESQIAQENWLQSLSANAAVELPPTEELTAEVLADFEPEVPYPLEICLPLAPKDAKFGVVVQPDGSLGMAPVPLRSTGYQNFDDRAKALVTNFEFPAAETTRLLVVEVPVDYNDVNCQPLDSASFEVPVPSTSASAGSAPSRPDTPPSNTATLPSATGEATPGPGTAIAFDPALQRPLLEAGRQRVEADAVGSLNTQLAIAAASLTAGWPEAVDQSCFLADLTTERFEPVAVAADALILSENADVPLILSRLYQATINDAGEYCGAALFQMSVAEIPQLYVSTIPFGSGGANALVVLWTADPREN